MISGVGFAMAKTMASLAHGGGHLGGQGAAHRGADEHIGAADGIGQCAGHPLGVGDLGQMGLVAGQALGTARDQDAVLVHRDDVAGAGGHQHLDDGGAGGAGGRSGRCGCPRFSCPTTFRALSRPASTMMAVPCWSSWKTGMSSSRSSVSSISKHSGLRMSSRLMPPKVGAIALHCGDDLLLGLGVDADGEGVHAAELFEQHALALHHGQGGFGADVAQAPARRCRWRPPPPCVPCRCSGRPPPGLP